MAEITHQVVTHTGGLIIRTPLSMWLDNGGVSKIEVQIDTEPVYTINQNFYNPSETVIIKIPSDQLSETTNTVALLVTDVTGIVDGYTWYFNNGGIDLTSWHYLDYNREVKLNDAAK